MSKKHRIRHFFIHSLSPQQVMLLGFGSVITIGALLLYTPWASINPKGTSLIDCFFTATSAVCVTGLTVVDTSTNWTAFGKTVIIALIQTGGLGFMSISATVALILGRKINIRQRILIKESFNRDAVAGTVRLIMNVIKFTAIIEISGALILMTVFIPEFGLLRGIGYSVFHSISAFCNAGFDILGGTFGKYCSLVPYADNPIIVFTICGLIILGGIGFGVIVNVTQKRHFKKFDLTSKLAIKTTLILLVMGTLLIIATEFTNPKTLGNMGAGKSFLVSFFQAVTCRTAGYATIDLSLFRESTLFFMMILMFIGASPSSTGGGIKTTTLAIIFASVRTVVKNDGDIVIYNKKISIQALRKALGVLSMAIVFITISTYLLTMTQGEDFGFFASAFESVSAFATVGLSLGGTPSLNSFGKLIIMIMMFSGRVGTLTMLTLIIHKSKKTHVKFPEESVAVG